MRVLRAFLICLALAMPVAAQPISGPVVVIDGDTLDVGGRRVRLFGIDAPEIGQSCHIGDTVRDCGRWVRDETEQRFGNRLARCHPVTRDKYDRIVARCTVDGVDIADFLVSGGLALAYRRYAPDYIRAEEAAAKIGRGIWQGRMQAPSLYRAALRAAPKGCEIKGNISARGRIFHVPGQEMYGVTRISLTRGEHWFCSEAQALAAGWRKALR